MDEVNETSVSQEVATPITENHESTTNQNSESKKTVEDSQDRNWKEMRRRQNDLEKDLQMQREMNERLMKMTAQSTPVKQEIDELDAISDDEFIPKGKVNKLVEKRAARIAEEIAKRETEKFFKQHNDSQFISRLKSKYSDFEEVVNSETMSLLEEQDPELAASIAELKDPYKIGMQCYKFMKASNLADKAPQSRRAKEVDKKLEQNEKVVQSPQVYDKRPMAQAFQMTKADYSNLYKEMMGFASGSY